MVGHPDPYARLDQINKAIEQNQDDMLTLRQQADAKVEEAYELQREYNEVHAQLYPPPRHAARGKLRSVRNLGAAVGIGSAGVGTLGTRANVNHAGLATKPMLHPVGSSLMLAVGGMAIASWLWIGPSDSPQNPDTPATFAAPPTQSAPQLPQPTPDKPDPPGNTESNGTAQDTTTPPPSGPTSEPQPTPSPPGPMPAPDVPVVSNPSPTPAGGGSSPSGGSEQESRQDDAEPNPAPAEPQPDEPDRDQPSESAPEPEPEPKPQPEPEPQQPQQPQEPHCDGMVRVDLSPLAEACLLG